MNMFKSQWFWVLTAAAVLLYLTFRSLSAIVFPFIMGLIGAYALNGAVTRLARHHISRGLGSALMVLTVIVSLVIMTLVFIPFVHKQLLALAVIAPRFVESWVTDLKPYLDTVAQKAGVSGIPDIKTHVSEHIGEIFSWSLSILTNLLFNSMAFANLLSLVILTPIIMFYILKDWPHLIQTIHNNIPYHYQHVVTSYAMRIDATLSAYAKGQAKVCLILMVLYSTVLWTIDVNQGIFIGIMTGFMSFIPYVGVLMGLLATLATCFAQFEGWNQIGLVLIVFIVIALFEGNILTPRFVGEKIGVHPVWIIFALLAGATWFGFFGVLLALPMAAVVGVLVRILGECYKNSSLYKGGET